jgi:hypothetical protein
MKKKVVLDEYILTIYCDGKIDLGGLQKYLSKKERSQISKLLKKPILALTREIIRK